MTRQHVETFARELLEAGWQPTPECCRVILGDAQAPRLVDCEVWKAMLALRDARQAREGNAGASANEMEPRNPG